MTTPPVHPALSNEGQLALLTVGVEPPLERIAALLQGPVDWPLLLAIAARQRALPQIWRRLSPLAGDRVPPQIAEEVQPLVMVADFTMGLLRERFEQSAAALADAGYRVLALKGAGLGLTAYPSFADRPMGDIDLLVDEEVAGDSMRLLLELGWVREFEDEYERFYQEHHHLSPLRFGGSEVRLELHTSLFAPGHPFELPLEQVWQRSREVPVRGAQVRVADPLDAMIHLSTHFLWSHGAISGAWRTFRDVDVLARSGDLDWDRLDGHARSARAGTCLYWTLRLARNLAAVPIPAEVLTRLRPAGPEFVLERLEHHLATAILPSARACPSMTVSRWMWEAVVRPRRSGHGSSRPWSRSELVRETFLRPGSDPFGRRALSQFQRLRAWGRYLAALFRSPTLRPFP